LYHALSTLKATLPELSDSPKGNEAAHCLACPHGGVVESPTFVRVCRLCHSSVAGASGVVGFSVRMKYSRMATMRPARTSATPAPRADTSSSPAAL
jgi:hypothetical protein